MEYAPHGGAILHNVSSGSESVHACEQFCRDFGTMSNRDVYTKGDAKHLYLQRRRVIWFSRMLPGILIGSR